MGIFSGGGFLGTGIGSGALVGGGLGGLVGGPIGALIGAGIGGQGDANQQNQSNFATQMDYETEMSNTAYQRAVMDMQKAGINPMLAAQNGGASTPGVQQPTMGNVMGQAASTAIQAQQLSANVKKTNSDIGVNDSLRVLQGSQAMAAAANARKAEAEAQLAISKLPTEKLEGRISSGVNTLIDSIGPLFNSAKGAAADAIAAPLIKLNELRSDPGVSDPNKHQFLRHLGGMR